MIKDQTLDEAIVEAMRFVKAAKALRQRRKSRRLGESYSAPRSNGDFSPEQVQAAMAAPYKAYVPSTPVEHAACKRASLDLTRKLADLRAGR